MIAYEEAMARGISEDRLDVSGTLQDMWDTLEFKQNLSKHDDTDDSEEEYEVYDTEALRGLDPEEFVEKEFPNGDPGWLYENDKRIQREFHGLESLVDRQRYDAFKDYMKRKDPLYKSPTRQIQTLNANLMAFVEDKNGPIFVSAGGAGAGKTSSALRVAKHAALQQFNPNTQKPSDNDYDFVLVEKDIEDEKDLQKILADYNGRLIIFDDKDKALVSTKSQIVSMMKAIADTNPDLRIFKNPNTGKAEKFTGQLLFITNKTMDKLMADEDHKAIMSRAQKHDIHFTIAENIDVLGDRYKKIGGKMKNVDAQDEAKIRKELFNFIKANKGKLDPAKFTVRKFEEALKYIDANEKRGKYTDDESKELFGEKEDWRKYIINDVLNKGETESDIEKGVFESTKETTSKMGEKSKKKILELYKKDPEEAIEMFGKEIISILNGSKDEKSDSEEGEEEVVKAFMGDLNGMSIEEAEEILGI